jgi:methylmalonyl-CoA mutase
MKEAALDAIAKELQFKSDFPKIDEPTWQHLAEKELKGAPFAKRMVTRTYDGIDLQPFYNETSFATGQDPAGLPGYAPFTRGTQPLGNLLAGWDIRQENAHPDPAIANTQILEDLGDGVVSVDLRLDGAGSHGLDADDPLAAGLTGRGGVSLSCGVDFEHLIAGVKLDIAGLFFDVGGAFLSVAALYVAAAGKAGVTLADLLGGFNADPLKVLMREGALPMPMAQAMHQMVDLAKWTAANAPRMTAVEVSTTPYHDAGASAAADIAFAIATGLDYLRALEAGGMEVDAAARQITFSMGLGCRFYLAIAKIRAARRLWADVVAASGGSAAAQKMRLRVSTGRRVLTTRDQSLNILRNTVACYAGAVGGADSITTTPFDAPTGLPSASARRNARNTHHILLEECHLAAVVDPAGGAWFVEAYTDALAVEAWSIVQQIEAQGGMLKATESGWVAAQLKPTEAAREKDVAVRKTRIVGISEHADVMEKREAQEQPDFQALATAAAQRLANWRHQHPGVAVHSPADGDGLTAAAVAAAQAGATLGQIANAFNQGEPATAAPLLVHPYDAAFEELRDASDAFAVRHGHRPLVYLAGIGSIAEQVARKGYAGDFFAVGGFEVVANEVKLDVAGSVAGFVASRSKIAVICSTDKQYATAVLELAPKLKAAGARTVLVAGSPGPAEAAWRAAGVDQFIYVRCDVVATLWPLLHAEEAQA